MIRMAVSDAFFTYKVQRQWSIFYRTLKKSHNAVDGQLTERKAGRPQAYYCCKGGTQKTGVPP